MVTQGLKAVRIRIDARRQVQSEICKPPVYFSDESKILYDWRWFGTLWAVLPWNRARPQRHSVGG
jgi:hypothetical protein